MNAIKKPVQKSFDSSSVYVSYFPHVTPSFSKSLSPEQKKQELKDSINSPEEIPLAEVFERGLKLKGRIDECRAIEDKKERQLYKKKNIGAVSMSATLLTRDKGVPLERKIKQYNSLMCLDFDDEPDLEALRNDLKSLPWVYYAGLSVSGKGMYALVPLDSEDFSLHKKFFNALKEEMEMLGHKIDMACSDVTRLRFLSYDPDAYFNENCEKYCLPEDYEEEEYDLLSPEPLEVKEMSGDERVETYVREWERKRVALDEYSDWITVGMALSTLGEKGRSSFHRVSCFSPKYKAEDTDKTFSDFVGNTRSIGLGSFFYKCHQYGVIPDSIPHYECIPFPVEVFPERVRMIIAETHDHQNFPIDYIAPSLLFAACLACGNSAVVEIQTGWREKPLLYLAIVGDRGTNKTSCFNFALAPIYKRDDRMYERYVEARTLYDAECMKPAKERKPNLEMPVYEQYVLSDFTPEVLVRQHKANPRGLIVFNDELIGFIYSFNKYRSGSDEQMWTQLFAGGGVTVNRVGSDPVKINDTCIGIFGGIQPDLLPAFARGKIQSGFVDRWLFAYPEKVRYPKFNDIDMDTRIAQFWNTIVQRILDIPYDGEAKVLKLSPDAKKLFKEWYDKLSDQKNCGGSAFAGLATKMDRYCGRVAMGLEAIKYGCNESDLMEISASSMRGAIALSYYFIACGLKAHKKFYSSPVENMPEIQKIVYEQLPQTFETKEGLQVALRNEMPERTFKRWLQSSMFKRLTYGYYEKRYK